MRIFLILLLFVTSLIYGMEETDSTKNKKNGLNPSLLKINDLEITTGNDLGVITNYDLQKLITALKNKSASTKWPLILLKGKNEITEKVAHYIVNEFQKKPIKLLPKELENPKNLMNLYQQDQQKEAEKNIIYTASNLRDLIESARKGYGQTSFDVPDKKFAQLLGQLSFVGPVIATAKQTKKLPYHLKKRFLSPFTCSTIILVKSKESETFVPESITYFSTQARSYCKQKTIDYAFQPSLDTNKFKDYRRIFAGFTNQEEIIKEIVARFKKYIESKELEVDECITILESIKLSPITIKTICFTNSQPDIEKQMAIKVIKTTSPESLAISDKNTEQCYHCALDLSLLRDCIFRYSQGKKVLNND